MLHVQRLREEVLSSELARIDLLLGFLINGVQKNTFAASIDVSFGLFLHFKAVAALLASVDLRTDMLLVQMPFADAL